MNRPLTQRQKDIFALIGKGMTNAEIAGTLGVTEKTVKNTALALYRALDCRNRVEVALTFHGVAFRD